jgi:hypothetical protein
MEIYAYMCTRNVVLNTVHINTSRVVPEREERCLATEDPKAALTKPSVHAGQRESPVELRRVVSAAAECMAVACVKHAGHMALPID